MKIRNHSIAAGYYSTAALYLFVILSKYHDEGWIVIVDLRVA
jgi:hypothetical protein